MRARRPLPRSMVLAVLLALLLSALPAAAGGTAAQPEILDATGDVDPASLAGLKPDQLESVQGNLSMFDLTKGYIPTEQRTYFVVVLEVVDLDGGLSDAPKPPTPPEVPVPATPPVPLVATFDTHFTIADRPFVARATLEPFHETNTTNNPPSAQVWFLANLTLHEDDAQLTLIDRLFGAVDVVYNRIFLVIPKALVGDPQPGTPLTKFYATSSFQGRVLDHGPDAALDPGQVDPLNPLKAPLAPGYGTDYTFGQFPGGAALFLRLAAEGPTSGSTKVGEPLEFAFKVTNEASQSDTVTLTARGASGWTVSFSEPTVTVGGGSSSVQTVTVVPTQNARQSGILTVKALSGLNGQSQTITYALQVVSGGGGGSGGGPGGGGASPTGGTETADSPSIAMVVPLVALVALAALVRRRT